MTHPDKRPTKNAGGGAQSMYGIGINDGDLIVVNRAKQARSGVIVVELVHGERTLKRLCRRDGWHWLVPEARGFVDIIVDEHVVIWDVVVGVALDTMTTPIALINCNNCYVSCERGFDASLVGAIRHRPVEQRRMAPTLPSQLDSRQAQ